MQISIPSPHAHSEPDVPKFIVSVSAMTRASTTKPFGHRARLSARRPRLLLLCAAVSAERSHIRWFSTSFSSQSAASRITHPPIETSLFTWDRSCQVEVDKLGACKWRMSLGGETTAAKEEAAKCGAICARLRNGRKM